MGRPPLHTTGPAGGPGAHAPHTSASAGQLLPLREAPPPTVCSFGAGTSLHRRAQTASPDRRRAESEPRRVCVPALPGERGGFPGVRRPPSPLPELQEAPRQAPTCAWPQADMPTDPSDLARGPDPTSPRGTDPCKARKRATRTDGPQPEAHPGRQTVPLDGAGGKVPLRFRISCASFSPSSSKPSAFSFFQANSSLSCIFRSAWSSDSSTGDSCSCGHGQGTDMRPLATRRNNGTGREAPAAGQNSESDPSPAKSRTGSRRRPSRDPGPAGRGPPALPGASPGSHLLLVAWACGHRRGGNRTPHLPTLEPRDSHGAPGPGGREDAGARTRGLGRKSALIL